MKTFFTFRNSVAKVGEARDVSKTLSAEGTQLNSWAQKLSKRLKYHGDIKVIHQNQDGAVMLKIDQEGTGTGQHIKDSAIYYQNLLTQ